MNTLREMPETPAAAPAAAVGDSAQRTADQLTLGAVILTMGNRPEEFAELLQSVAAQQGDPIRVVVVCNGVPAARLGALPEGVQVVELPENIGIPAGRNVGVRELTDVDVVLFLDDDGRLAGTDTGLAIRQAFAEDPRLGIVSFRIVDPETGVVQRRHVPRLRVGDTLRSSPVTSFLGGASAVRRAVFDGVGLLADEFFLFHEETDLAWRALDAGWSVRYRADIVLCHPATTPSRHALYHRLVARNRVWVARRNLPWPLVPIYLTTWIVLTLVRTRRPAALRAWFAGFWEGWRTPCGLRHAMSWRTVWRLTLLGRPPFV
jgi:GT2 family glycosyltransferase